MNISGMWQPGSLSSPNGADFVSHGLGLVLGPHVRRYEDDEHVLFIEGTFHDRPVADGLKSIAVLEQAFGYFAYIRQNKHTGAIDIGSDCIGFFPIYFAPRNQGLVFATTLGFVTANLPGATINFDAWEELLALGDVLGDKTVVEEVQRLRFGTRIRIEGGKWKLVQFWKPEQPELVDNGTYVRRSNELLAEAVELTRDVDRPKVVLLSGGEDSRRLAAAVKMAGMPATLRTQSVSHQGGFDIDTSLAREVARMLGEPLVVEPLPSPAEYVSDWHNRNVLSGFECIAHEWIMPLIRHLPPKSLVYDGLHGGVLNGHYFKEFPEAIERYSPEALAGMICAGSDKPWLSEIRRHTRSTLFERVRDLLARYPDSPNRINWYFTLHHTRRKIAFAAQLFAREGHWICYPFTYMPLLLHSYSADHRVQRDRFMQRECLAAVWPEGAKIPSTRGTVPPEFLTDMSVDDRLQRVALWRQLEVSEEALRLLPSFRTRYRLLNRLRFFAGTGLFSRNGWFLEPAARLSGFLDWLKDAPAAAVK